MILLESKLVTSPIKLSKISKWRAIADESHHWPFTDYNPNLVFHPTPSCRPSRRMKMMIWDPSASQSLMVVSRIWIHSFTVWGVAKFWFSLMNRSSVCCLPKAKRVAVTIGSWPSFMSPRSFKSIQNPSRQMSWSRALWTSCWVALSFAKIWRMIPRVNFWGTRVRVLIIDYTLIFLLLRWIS